jgi:hypothetical protein
MHVYCIGETSQNVQDIKFLYFNCYIKCNMHFILSFKYHIVKMPEDGQNDRNMWHVLTGLMNLFFFFLWLPAVDISVLHMLYPNGIKSTETNSPTHPYLRNSYILEGPAQLVYTTYIWSRTRV